MPSSRHEGLLQLFRNQPTLAAELLRKSFDVGLPPYKQARIDSAEFTDIQPAKYHADLVVQLVDEAAVQGIVVEVQLSIDERKRRTWPAYVINLYAQLGCPVYLLIVTPSERVARWAAKPIEIGGGSCVIPRVLCPAVAPEITDAAQACADPELAVLSAMVHGQSRDTRKSVQIASVAQQAALGLDDERYRLYVDLIRVSLSDAARRELQSMDMSNYEVQDDFLRRFLTMGRTEGKAEIILRQLALRFGPIAEDVAARIKKKPIRELDRIGERLLTAPTLREALKTR